MIRSLQLSMPQPLSTKSILSFPPTHRSLSRTHSPSVTKPCTSDGRLHTRGLYSPSPRMPSLSPRRLSKVVPHSTTERAEDLVEVDQVVEENGLSAEIADKIGTYVRMSGKPLDLLSDLKEEGNKFLENSSSIDALNDLKMLFKCLKKSGCIDKVVFDLSLARGMDYYIGVIYEAVFKDGELGSIAAGGRYDNLIGMFRTKQAPMVGVSLGIERVFAMMEQIHKDQNQSLEKLKML